MGNIWQCCTLRCCKVIYYVILWGSLYQFKLTKTRRFLLPSSISQTWYSFDRLSSRESKTSVTLIHGLSSICNIGWANRKAVIDLRYWSTINFLAVWNVIYWPITTVHTLCSYSIFSSSKFLTSWARKGNNSTKCSVSTGCQCTRSR